ncbi:uncharacterized protein FMAN_10037 [Fusarium mangiferae]|uniref:Nephrocystin 3-like N-terminal domain-containing protein n=1 Tax=Fusarium mangiferae TaxID=192010 RepID=A0A1L7TV14_FUSMA|nr:uncharacterized protein FMAN_10037 [Fusarium mangiferae]CVL00692.1 uncharacterized protein FMAN_10037 [Fusarium mangiferae]
MADPSTYTVGWICALTTELVAAKSFFDEEYEVNLDVQAPGDNNSYSFGRMGKHDVVVASLPRAEYGIAPAASVARDMLRTFPNIRVGLMVGIGGGAPRPEHDIRLGDVVVSVPSGAKGGVLHHNRGKTIQQQEFQLTGSLNQPPQFVLTAVGALEVDYEGQGHELNERIEEALSKRPRLKKRYARPTTETDRLYESSHIHSESPKSTACKDNCGEENLIIREVRGDDDDDPMIHYGLIASSDMLMKDATIRDKLASDEGVLCFEMEAAGLMNHFPCLIICGICDYADSHKNKEWQGFAAVTAAAYAKELLQKIAPTKIQTEKPLAKVISELGIKLENITTHVEDINDTVNTLHADNRRAEIERWLKPPRVSTNVEKAKMRRHDGSGQWFIDSSAFQEFKAGSRQHLWLHGLAGCGKTVLSSRILDDLRDTSDTITLAHYFDFNDVKKQSLDGLLRSLAFQLYRQGSSATSSPLDQLFTSYEGGSTEPDILDLESCVSAMFKAVGQALILIDALDECTCRKFLLPWIGRTGSESIRFILTARPENDIRTHLYHFFGVENCVDLDKASIDRDIKSYVLAILETDPRFTEKGLSRELRTEISNKIGCGADGMFRWAACQMDDIAECLSPNDVQKCLKTLPRDLKETYNRMLERIHPGYRSDSIRLLQFLIHHSGPLPIDLGVEIVATRMDHVQKRPRFDIGNRPFNSLSIERYCPGFISVIEVKDSGQKEIHISHFSVQELLLEYEEFSKEKSAVAITQTFLAYLAGIEGPLYRMPFDFPLAMEAAWNWPVSALVAGLEEDTVEMAAEFLSNDKMVTRWYRICIPNPELPLEVPRTILGITVTKYFEPPSPTTSGLEHACKTGHLGIIRRLIQISETRVDKREIETSLRVAAVEHMELHWRDWGIPQRTPNRFFNLLFSDGIESLDPQLWRSMLQSFLSIGFYYGHLDMVKQSIEAGADIETFVKRFGCRFVNHGGLHHLEVSKFLRKWASDPEYWESLLRISIEFDDSETVEALLDEMPDGCSAYKVLEAASFRKREDLVRLLLQKGTVFDNNFINLAPGRENIMQALLDHGYDVSRELQLGGPLATVLHPKNQRLREIICNAAIANPKVSERAKDVLKAALDSKNNEFVEYLCDQNPLVICQARYSDLQCIDTFFEVLLGEHRHFFQLLIKRGTKDFVKVLGAPLSPLIIAAFNGHADIVEELIESGIGMVSEQLMLYCAITEGHEQVLQVLLDHDFNLNARFDSPWLENRVRFSRRNRGILDRAELSRIAADLPPRFKPAQDTGQDGVNMALWWALLGEKDVIVQMLLDHGAEFHGIDLKCNTALHLASLAGFQQTVRALLKKGADIHAVNKAGRTPLHVASVHVAQMLVDAGADIEAKDNRGWTVMHHASKLGDVSMLRFLASHGADFSARTADSLNALHVARSPIGIGETFGCLIENGVDVMDVDEEGSTLLHKACLASYVASVRLLIKAGLSIHARDNKGRTPLHRALELMSVTSLALVSYLLDRGACVNARDNQGCTALHHTIDLRQDISNICAWITELILDHGADINARDINGETAVFRAFSNRDDFDPAKLLLERGADVNIPNNKGDTILHQGSDGNLGLLKMLLGHGGDVNALNNKGESPLASALMRGKRAEQVADMLVSWGAKDIRNGQEQNKYEL